MNNILVDTGYWYALFSKNDAYHEKAEQIKNMLPPDSVIIAPYPILYETLNTSFVTHGQKLWMGAFKDVLGQSQLISDDIYKTNALETLLNSYPKRPMSLVDMTLRFMLEDVNLHINTLITFNEADFADVCRSRGIMLISDRFVF